MQRKNRLASTTQVPSLYSMQNVNNVELKKKSVGKRESKLSSMRTNNDLKNVRNMPTIQGASINTIMGHHNTNNSDLYSSSEKEMRKTQEKVPAHKAKKLVNILSPQKQSEDKQATRNFYGVRVLVDDQSINGIASGRESPANNKDLDARSNKLLSDRAQTLKQTTIDQISQYGVPGASHGGIISNSGMPVKKQQSQVTRIGQRDLYHSRQSTSQYTDGESEIVMRATDQGGQFSGKMPLPSVAGIPYFQKPTTVEQGTDVRSGPQTAAHRQGSGDTTIVTQELMDQQETTHESRVNLKTSSTAGGLEEQFPLMGYQGNDKVRETALNTVHLQQLYANTAPQIVLLLQGQQASPQANQLIALEQMRASLKIQKNAKKGTSKTTLQSKRGSQRSLTQRSSLPINSTQDAKEDLMIGEDGTKLVGQEAQMTNRALQEYKRKKHRLMKNRRVFGDKNIAQIDDETKVRARQVASLLGNTKEALDIQESFKKMIEVPQEDFKLENYKELTAELRNKIRKPAPIYLENLKINPKHTKKLSTIEDFVTVLPTSAESNFRQQDFISDLAQETYASMSSREKQLALTEEAAPLAILAEDQQTMLLEEHNQEDGDGDDGNTFITNMVNAGAASPTFLTTETAPVLPRIDGKSSVNLATPHQNSNRLKGQQTTVDTAASARYMSSVFKKDHNSQNTNEYQLMPVIDSASKNNNNNPDLHYRNSAGSLALQKTGTRSKGHNSNSMSVFTPAKNQLTQQLNAEIIPFQSAQMAKESSEISFTNARKIATKNSTKTQYKRPAYRHSTLKSALGKESRVLQQIYKRVENFQKKEDDGSRLGYVKGMVEIIQHLRKDQESAQKLKTAHQLRKQSMPLMPIFVGQEQSFQYIESHRERSLQPLTYEDESVGKYTENDEQHHSPTLADSRKLTQNDARFNSAAQLHIVDGYAERSSARDSALAMRSKKQNDDQQSPFTTLQTQKESLKLRPWNHEKTTLSSNPTLQVTQGKSGLTPAHSMPPNLPKGDSPAQKRVSSQTMLDQYKQRRALVSNLQISKLIRKDTSYFTGSARQIGDRQMTGLQLVNQLQSKGRQNYERKFGKKRNSMLDESSDDGRRLDIDQLFRPLDQQLHEFGMYTTSKQLSAAGNIDIFKADERISVRIPQVNKDKLIKIEQQSDRNSQQLKPLAQVKSLNNNEHRSKLAKDQLIRSAFDKTPPYQASIVDSSNMHLSPIDKSMQNKQDRAENIQQEMNEYYRSLNKAARNSANKLSKVVIRGKNILETTNFVSHSSVDEQRQGTQMLKQQSSDSRTGAAATERRRVVQNYSGTTSRQQKPKYTPISVHIAKNKDGSNQVIDHQSAHESSYTEKTLRFQKNQLPGQQRNHARTTEGGLIQLKSSDTVHGADQVAQSGVNFKAIIEQSDDNLREMASHTANVTFLQTSHEGDLNVNKQKSDLLNPNNIAMQSTVKHLLESSQQHESSVNDPYGASQGPKIFNAMYEKDGLSMQNGLRKGSQSLLHHSNSQQQPQQYQVRQSYEYKFADLQPQPSKATHEAHRVNIDSPFFPGVINRKKHGRAGKATGSQETLSSMKKYSSKSPRRNASQQSGPISGSVKQQYSQHQQLHALEQKKAAQLSKRRVSQVGKQNAQMDVEGVQVGIQSRHSKSRGSRENQDNHGGPASTRLREASTEMQQMQNLPRSFVVPESSSEATEPWQFGNRTAFDSNMMASKGTLGLGQTKNISLNQTLRGSNSGIRLDGQYQQSASQLPTIQVNVPQNQSNEAVQQIPINVQSSEYARYESQGRVDTQTFSHQKVIVTEATSPREPRSPNPQPGSQLQTPMKSLSSMSKSKSKLIGKQSVGSEYRDNVDLLPVINADKLQNNISPKVKSKDYQSSSADE